MIKEKTIKTKAIITNDFKVVLQEFEKGGIEPGIELKYSVDGGQTYTTERYYPNPKNTDDPITWQQRILRGFNNLIEHIEAHQNKYATQG